MFHIGRLVISGVWNRKLMCLLQKVWRKKLLDRPTFELWPSPQPASPLP